MTSHTIQAGDLAVAFEAWGTATSAPTVILLHGFPYDVRAYDAVAPRLADLGCRVIVPYLRGYGPTRFLSATTLRSGEQAVLGRDLLALIDALAIERAVLAGYDWGGRAACIVAALWPQRVAGLVTGNGYNIQHIASADKPLPPEDEYRYWYQYYFHGERGRRGLTENRAALCRLLWHLWSPTWAFDDETFARTAVSFDNPDFVDVVIHSYRHRFGLVAGAPEGREIEKRLAARPRIAVPTITLDGDADGVLGGDGAASDGPFFTGPYERRVIAGAGHNLPQEAPEAFVDAIRALLPGPGAR